MGRKSIELLVATDPDWVNFIITRFDAFLADHANCERKASALAMSLVVKYPDRGAITDDLIGLAQEELAHFRQVYALMRRRGLSLVKDTQDPYVNRLLALTRDGREQRFLDRLLIFSLVEGRGAERFSIIADAVADPELREFYRCLGKSETKHAHQFVDWALRYQPGDVVYPRLQSLAESEAEIITSLSWRASLH